VAASVGGCPILYSFTTSAIHGRASRCRGWRGTTAARLRAVTRTDSFIFSRPDASPGKGGSLQKRVKSVKVKVGSRARLNGMSVLFPAADVVRPPRHVRVVPRSDVRLAVWTITRCCVALDAGERLAAPGGLYRPSARAPTLRCCRFTRKVDRDKLTMRQMGRLAVRASGLCSVALELAASACQIG
jgi:hypothetical protein